MCFKRKTKKPQNIEGAKYLLEDFVSFHYHGELRQGHIRFVYRNDKNEINYQIQVGGECTWIASCVSEKDIGQLIKRKLN